ncbi:MAG: threonine synthase [Spirochaetia bacterium]|nr:threonine synthase [Spirochaetia bacterium]
MRYSAHFRCINGCTDKISLNTVIYRCPTCNNLLEVIHDMDALKDRSSQSWISLFNDRYRSSEFPYGSGVWGKKEWILPEIDSEHIVSMYEGATNLFRSQRLEKLFKQREIWVKLCGNSHTGSFKDLGMTVLVSQVKSMIAAGQPIRAIACASTGDTSAALAAYAANAEIPAIILLPKNKVSLTQLIQPVANGAMVLALDTDFDGCMKIVQELTYEKEIYLANSMNSLRIEGQKTVGIEVIQQLDWRVPDWFIIPGGNLGNVSALGNGLLMLLELGLIQKLPRIALAQAEKASPLYESFKKGFEEFKPVKAQKTLASAIQIGNPVSVNKAIKTLRRFNGVVEQTSEDELANASALADFSGLMTDPHTGVALAALQKLKSSNTIQHEETVVVISTANGLKFTDFKVKYHENTLDEVNVKYQNIPIEIEANIDIVKKLVHKKVEELMKHGLE